MRKHISFAIAATIVGLAIFFWVSADVVETNADVARPTLDHSSPMANPYLTFRVLDPVY
jgi:hypothetical protein